MAFRLITSDDLKALGKGAVTNTFDFLIDDIIIPAVGEIFAHYCHRESFDRIERTEFFSPIRWQSAIFLSALPIQSTPAVKVFQDTNYPRTYPPASELVNGTDYIVHDQIGVIEKIGSFPCGPRTIKAIYTAGYLTDDAEGVPADLRLAAIFQAKILFDRREELSLTSKSLEGGSISLLVPLIVPKSVALVLDKYRLVASN